MLSRWAAAFVMSGAMLPRQSVCKAYFERCDAGDKRASAVLSSWRNRKEGLDSMHTCPRTSLPLPLHPAESAGERRGRAPLPGGPQKGEERRDQIRRCSLHAGAQKDSRSAALPAVRALSLLQCALPVAADYSPYIDHLLSTPSLQRKNGRWDQSDVRAVLSCSARSACAPMFALSRSANVACTAVPSFPTPPRSPLLPPAHR